MDKSKVKTTDPYQTKRNRLAMGKEKGNQEKKLRFYCSCYLKNSFKNEIPLYISTLKQSLITTKNIIIIRSVV
jgi:hypothetical protein